MLLWHIKKQVDQIILISGDSDFIPAAKLARREGIDIILDPMKQHVKPDLNKYVDGVRNQVSAMLSPNFEYQELKEQQKLQNKYLKIKT